MDLKKIRKLDRDMNYKKGDKVKYKYTKLHETCCDKCGHCDYEYTEEIRDGFINEIKKGFIMRMQDITVTDEEVFNKDGKRVYRPYQSGLKPCIEEFIYIIDDNEFTEEDIIK